ncbi:chemotaxis protein [Convivina intestini]|uniref:chemotaxis protein n=1 Tax=Convivina intestini TaxID=1505726 RepID=UPI00200EB441|nr:chemotaxis protein [Convivina intestini]CAH1855570.1 hypothetical protein R078131_01213 [Convivina intestini]
MPKFNPKQIQHYIQALQEILSTTQDAANHVSPYFVKLDDARQANKLSEMPAVDFAEIKAEFDDVVTIYQENATKLADLKAPVRWLGVNKSLANNYQKYAEATAMMANALDVDQQTIDEAKFSQSEEDQQTYLAKVQANVGKIFGTAG